MPSKISQVGRLQCGVLASPRVARDKGVSKGQATCSGKVAVGFLTPNLRAPGRLRAHMPIVPTFGIPPINFGPGCPRAGAFFLRADGAGQE
jgi:hypothetical protein